MTDFEFGWVVALLEGEGCFYCGWRKNKNSKSWTTRIIVSMIDKDTLDRLYEYCGGWVGGPYQGHSGKGKRRKATKLYWSWNLWGQNAIDLMSLVYPHMSLRRQTKIAEIRKHFAESLKRRALTRSENGHKAVKFINEQRAAKAKKKRRVA